MDEWWELRDVETNCRFLSEHCFSYSFKVPGANQVENRIPSEAHVERRLMTPDEFAAEEAAAALEKDQVADGAVV